MLKKIFIWPLILLILNIIFYSTISILSGEMFYKGYGGVVIIFITAFELTSLIIYFSLVLISWLLSKKIKFLTVDIKLIFIYGLLSLIIAIKFYFLTVFFIGLVLK